MLVGDFERGLSAFRALEISGKVFLFRRWSNTPGNPGAQKNAGRILCQRPGPLKNRINARQEAGRDDTFQQANPEIGDCQCSIDVETKVCQPAKDTAGLEVKVQSGEFHRFWCKRTPGLETQRITQDGFNVAFISEFQDKVRARVQDIPYLPKRSGGISHMMQDADHGSGVE